MGASDSTVEWRVASEATMRGPWSGWWLGVVRLRRLSPVDAVRTLPRSWPPSIVRPPGSVRCGLLQRATSASRMTRAQRSAKGYTRMEGAKRAASIC